MAEQTMMGRAKNLAGRINNSGRDALSFMVDGVDHVIAHNDWDHMARFLHDIPESDESLAKRYLRALVGDQWILRKDKKAKYGYVFKPNKAKGVATFNQTSMSNHVRAALLDAVADGKSWRSKVAMDAIKSDKDTSSFDTTKKIESFIKSARNHDVPDAEIVKALREQVRALEADLSAAKAASNAAAAPEGAA